MEKKLENISKLADDIVLTEQNERKLFIAYKKRIESQRRKKVLMRTKKSEKENFFPLSLP